MRWCIAAAEWERKPIPLPDVELAPPLGAALMLSIMARPHKDLLSVRQTNSPPLQKIHSRFCIIRAARLCGKVELFKR